MLKILLVTYLMSASGEITRAPAVEADVFPDDGAVFCEMTARLRSTLLPAPEGYVLVFYGCEEAREA